MKPKVLVLRAAGINCDAETAYAFELVGADPDIVHVNRLREQKRPLQGYRFIAIPGGFSYGDDIASGRVLANELLSFLRDELAEFVANGGYIIGICNGFQVLVKSGLLPGFGARQQQMVTLTHNRNHRYTDRWVRLDPCPGRCVWLPDDEPIELPVAHAEGRFTAPEETLDRLQREKQIALCYQDEDNFNGSDRGIAGICDPTGRILGLMPHPERFLRWEHHPRWTRLPRQREGAGVRLFRAALRHSRES